MDGVALSGLFTHRETSPDFSFVSVPNNPIGDPAGNSGIAVADGYWLMLAPLSTGPHTLNFGGGISSYQYSIDVTDAVTAVPEPATFGAMGMSLAALSARRRSRR